MQCFKPNNSNYSMHPLPTMFQANFMNDSIWFIANIKQKELRESIILQPIQANFSSPQQTCTTTEDRQ